jgi:hypothetical protein
MMLANCVLAVFQPRYTLPMLELTIISAFILFGEMMDSLFSPAGRLLGDLTNRQNIRITPSGESESSMK